MLMSFAKFFSSPVANLQKSKEQSLIIFTSFISMLVIGLLSTWVAPSIPSPLLVASLGASTILVFVLPNSPVSQPYPLIMGHLVSAIIGVSCAYLPFDLYINAAISLSACMLVMFMLNCVHPPGGATALMPVVIGAPAVDGYNFVLFPVLFSMLTLVTFGVIFHRFWLKQDFPSKPLPSHDVPHKHDDQSPLTRLGIDKSDLQGALQEFDMNIAEKDLAQVYGMAQQKAYTRKFGEICCVDIMSQDVKTVREDSELEEAWALLKDHKVKLLPVVDENRAVVGIISLNDYLKRANTNNYDGFALCVEEFVKLDPSFINNKLEFVGQIMASVAFTIHQNELITSLIPLLTNNGFHQILIVNDVNQLTGIVTQSDLIAALYTSSITSGSST